MAVKDFSELPAAMSVMDLQKALNISRGNAYALTKRQDFPAIRLGERRLVIPRDKFVEWLHRQAEQAE